MTAIIKEEILPFRAEILKALNHCRFDKIKPVREATLETIKLLKEIVGTGGCSDTLFTSEEDYPQEEVVTSHSQLKSAGPSRR